MGKLPEKYIFIGKTLFFPKEKILAIGDLHLGYEEMLKERGVQIKINQLAETIKELDKVFEYLSKNKLDVKKIVLLGDVKHYFSFSSSELNLVNRFLDYLGKKINLNNIIMIKGNHDTFNLGRKKFVDYYIFRDIAFIHGDKDFLEIYDKNVNYVIMSHIHPRVTISDKMQIKREKYKCFLSGKYRDKNWVILPSFLPFLEGSDIEKTNLYERKNFSIVKNKELENFNVFVVSDDELKPKDFGKLKNL